jgi:hypothetical protein
MGPAHAKPNSTSTSEHKVTYHDSMSRIAFLPGRRQSLHGSLNGIGIAQGADLVCLVAAVITGVHVVEQTTADKLRAAKRDVVLRTDPTYRAPHAGARVPTDAPHDADVVSAHQDGAAAPAGQPARERVEQCERREVLGSQIRRRVREPAEGGRAGCPLGAVDDQEQLVCRRQWLGGGETAGVSQHEQRADDVLWVLLLREGAHLWGSAARPSRAAAAGGRLEPWAALDADERVEVLPEELAVEFLRKVDVTGGKGVDHEEGIHVGVEEAAKGLATVSELLHDRACHVKGIGGHCNTKT